MIGTLFFQSDQSDMVRPQEGALFKVIDLYGFQFPLYYGYYDETERENPASELMPIYPDFVKEPLHTADGFPFVTKMQDPCKHYQGKAGSNNDCAECAYYQHGDELLGICICPKNKRNEK